MPIKLAMIMDPIDRIDPNKDTSFALLLAAQQRGWDISLVYPADIYARQGQCYAKSTRLTVHDNPQHWFDWLEQQESNLSDFDVILIRKDPPFNMQYIYLTYLLELVSQHGTLVLNHPRALRDNNEKFSLHQFPHCCPPTLVSCQATQIKLFLQEYQTIVLKPLDGMAGQSIFYVTHLDVNTHVIIDTLTAHGQIPIMAQQFLPAIAQGDKRIILIDGEPIPHALCRMPPSGQIRANLAVGGTAVAQAQLSEREYFICQQVGPVLRAQGLLFVGLDVIGDYLTEINVTSPTGVRQLEKWFGIDICGQFLDCVEQRLH